MLVTPCGHAAEPTCQKHNGNTSVVSSLDLFGQSTAVHSEVRQSSQPKNDHVKKDLKHKTMLQVAVIHRKHQPICSLWLGRYLFSSVNVFFQHRKLVQPYLVHKTITTEITIAEKNGFWAFSSICLALLKRVNRSRQSE